jgi:hypothetical protein
MAGNSGSGSVPVWTIPLAVIAAVILVGFVAWRSLGRNPSAGEGPPMQVRPGMYSIQKEAAEGHLGNGLKGGALPGPANP